MYYQMVTISDKVYVTCAHIGWAYAQPQHALHSTTVLLVVTGVAGSILFLSCCTIVSLVAQPRTVSSHTVRSSTVPLY